MLNSRPESELVLIENVAKAIKKKVERKQIRELVYVADERGLWDPLDPNTGHLFDVIDGLFALGIEVNLHLTMRPDRQLMEIWIHGKKASFPMPTYLKVPPGMRGTSFALCRLVANGIVSGEGLTANSTSWVLC